MKTTFHKVISAGIIASLLSCTKTGTAPDSDRSGDSKANTVQGTIFDAHNNKFNIPDATVIVHALGNIGSIGDHDAMYNIPMDQNSHFEASVKSGLYMFHARAFMPLNGRTVCIDLAPVDGKRPDITQAAAPGIAKDFKLQLTGLAPWGDASNVEDYYGAHINFADGKYSFTSDGYWDNLATSHPGAKIVFTLTIQSPLIDGTPGESQQVECAADALKTGQWFVNIPFAAYRVTATLVEANGAQKNLKLSFISGNNAHSDYLDLLFPPNPDDMDGHPSEPLMAVWED
jgi:hypothetical protein